MSDHWHSITRDFRVDRLKHDAEHIRLNVESHLGDAYRAGLEDGAEGELEKLIEALQRIVKMEAPSVETFAAALLARIAKEWRRP